MLDVLVVGELNVDIILNQIDGFPEVGKEILANQMTVTLGSSSAIFASNLSSLGSRVSFLGKIGNDHFADIIEESLKTKGVETDFIIRSKEFKTGSTIVMNYDMDRANVTFPGAMNHLSAKEVRDDILTEAKHLHVSSIFMQPALKPGLTDLFQRAKEFGLTTSIDPQWDPKEEWDVNLKALLPLVDVFLPNTTELLHLTGADTIEAGIDQIKEYANIIVVKDGTNGACLFRNGNIHKLPAFINHEAIDAIGAGDSFDAGFIHKYIQNLPLEECLRFGNLTGAINTTEAGGTTAFESIEKIKEIAQSRFAYTI
ncbi:carbohydrate kinase family protein [Marinoscillum sp.]|uniref:carbohydrate kinase family protein n=1 Tax=Marinoscillum sp. TaxID=2024838 RepID=UPI003BAC2D14